MRYECPVLEQRTGTSLKLSFALDGGDTQADPNVEGGIEKAVTCHGRILISIYVFDPRSLCWPLAPGFEQDRSYNCSYDVNGQLAPRFLDTRTDVFPLGQARQRARQRRRVRGEK